MFTIENDRDMPRIRRMREEKYRIFSSAKFFERCFVIYESDDDLSISSDTRLLYEDEIPVVYSFFIHRVSISPEEKILVSWTHNRGGNRNRSFDILLGKYRHSASNSTNEWNRKNWCTFSLKRWSNTNMISNISVDPSFFDELIQKDRYRSWWSIWQSALKCSHRDFLSFRKELLDFLENELFFGREFFHKIIA